MDFCELSPEAVWLFRHNGFLKLPNVLSPERVAALRDAILHDVAKEVGPVVRNTEGRVVRLSRLLDRDRVFRETGCKPDCIGASNGFVGAKY